MDAKSTPIRRKLITIALLTSGVVLLISTVASFAYEYLTYRQVAVRNLTTLGSIIATNSTAALAFENEQDARSILSALRAEPHIVAGALYDDEGRLFATYPEDLTGDLLPVGPEERGYRFERAFLEGFQPVAENGHRMGTLYLRSDMEALYAQLRLHGVVAALIIALACIVAYVMSRSLQRQISRPILALAETADAVSSRRDYSVRAPASSTQELGQLTDAFNHMLTEIQAQTARLNSQLGSLHLLQHITRAIGERQDLQSVFRVVLQSLEERLPIDFGCICLHEPGAENLTVATIGARSTAAAGALGVAEQATVPVDQNGLSTCLAGQVVYEPDVRDIQFPFPRRFAAAGFHALVIAPLIVENRVFGVLIAARRPSESFSSQDCELLRQLSEHVALASHQAQLYGALQQAYDDLRQTQHTVMQQERLRALGQMASGIAHDINNAISPVSLYTESLLEREPNLSERARGYLTTIQRAMDDVAATVARMREFYRQREPQLELSRINLNRIVQEVVELTHARWSDLPMQRGVVVELKMEAAPDLPEVMGAENEIRDALTNLIFNAVDAMPEGGLLTLRTRVSETHVTDDGQETVPHVCIEVADTGVGMDEETRRRCLEPFFTTKGERGTGLGLAMVYGMVQRHSAELQVDSEPGKGTTFRLIFPAYTAAFVGTVRVPAQVIAQRLRILLIDDDPLLIKSLQDTLEGDGHMITTAHGGQAGIDAFAAASKGDKRFDIVVTDLGMPYVDGRKVAATIRAVSSRTPIIMLTGWGQRLVAENDVPPHVDKVLNKPPRLHELRAALAELTAS
jgi:signal transduction histidine kinase/ActR/RegA family two-component response regulator/HAMP domain-containing protein